MIRWEYFVVKDENDQDFNDFLDDMGEDGWEYMHQTGPDEHLFKRSFIYAVDEDGETLMTEPEEDDDKEEFVAMKVRVYDYTK